MTTVEEIADLEVTPKWPARFQTVALGLLIFTLAWAPFPLGSNRPWSWSVLSILIALSWVFWALSQWMEPSHISYRFYRLPALLFGATLIWAGLQAFPHIPSGWGHPAWQIVADALGLKVNSRISIDPWRTITEMMKLITYLMGGALAIVLCHRSERAKILFSAILVIATLYAFYGIALAMLNFGQQQLFYSGWNYNGNVNGPFVSRNNFATYLGMGVILAAVHIYPSAARHIVTGRGIRQQAFSFLQYVFGIGVGNMLALVGLFSVLVATGSRAGFLATLLGLAVILLLAAAARRGTRGWVVAGLVAMVAGGIVIFLLDGDALQSRFTALAGQGGDADPVRTALWDAAQRMVGNAPWLGLGLGTFERAYPLYADRILPFVVDKAHNDYLEFAAGIGLPAAIAWWAALGLCLWKCARAVFIRRRNRLYPMAAVGAGTLVAFHSIFDFSLQIPAVALTFSVILGLGLAQARPSRNPV